MSTNDATALIAEDEPLLAQALQAELAQLWPGLRIVAMAENGAQALQNALELKPSVCFLDIRMPAMSGLEVAQALAEDWPDDDTPFPLLVFITAYDQYAVQAFERQAVDYLLKPVDASRLAQCCTRLQDRLAQQRPLQPAGDPALEHTLAALRSLLATGAPSPGAPLPRLEVIQAGVGQTVHMVPVGDVLYFEAADKYVRVVTADREHLIRTSLRDLLPQLDTQRFWQVHRSIVVQVRMVQSAVRDESGKVTLSLPGRPEKLAVSRLYAHLFKAM